MEWLDVVGWIAIWVVSLFGFFYALHYLIALLEN